MRELALPPAPTVTWNKALPLSRPQFSICPMGPVKPAQPESQMAWYGRSESWVGTFSLDQWDDPEGRLCVENSSVVNRELFIVTLKMLSQSRTRRRNVCGMANSPGPHFLSPPLNYRVSRCHLPHSLTSVLFKPLICQSKKQQSISNVWNVPG